MNANPSFLPEPESLVSIWRRFGTYGPPYRIDAVVGRLENGDTVFRVTVPHPVGEDENVERRFSQILADPEEP